MNRLKRTAVSGLLLIPFAIQGQSAQNNRPLPTTVPLAEAEGARFGREAAPSPLPEDFQVDATEGSIERKCVEFPAQSAPLARRSGEFIVGGQISSMTAGAQGKVWWMPLHDPASRKASLEVRSVRLDAQPDASETTSTFVSRDYAFPVTVVARAMPEYIVDEEHAFYPSGFSLPSAGRWLLTVSSASDWGCFIVTVGPVGS